MALTKHKEGSLKELWCLSFPLMLSSFSMLLMIFSDRWLLAQYSVDAHNAAVSATTFAWGFLFGSMSLAGITEVFVAQYNGAGKKHKTGEPVWQMIWLSIFSSFFFLPFSYLGTPLFFGSGVETALEREYFSIMLLFGPFCVLYTALCGFFIGQGKTKLVTWVVIFANLFNIGLDYLLIFGVEGIIPSLGVKGAAFATSASTLFEGLILGIVFLNKKNRIECGTVSWKPRFKAMVDCVKIGLPTSIFIVAEMLAFGCYYMIMKEKGPVFITVAGICQSIVILFFFFGDGMHKATTAIVGNMIGAGRSLLIPQVIKAGLLLNLIFFALVAVFFFFGTSFLITQFLPNGSPVFIEEIYEPLKFSLMFFAVYIFFEGLRMMFMGVLTASGDTVFLLLFGGTSVWLFMWLPVYLFIGLGSSSVEMGALISVCYSAILSGAYYWRIRINQRQSIESLVN